MDFYEILYLRIFRKHEYLEKIRVPVMYNECYVVCTAMIISRGILLRLRNILDKSFSENQIDI